MPHLIDGIGAKTEQILVAVALGHEEYVWTCGAFVPPQVLV